MPTRQNSVRVVPHSGAITIASVRGVLDQDTYPQIRDGLLKIAAESSDGLLADIEQLEIPDAELAGVFRLVALRVRRLAGDPLRARDRRGRSSGRCWAGACRSTRTSPRRKRR